MTRLPRAWTAPPATGPALLAAAALALAFLPAGAAVSVGDGTVSLGGLSRPAAWVLLWSCWAVGGLTRLSGARLPRGSWAVVALSAAVALLRFPAVLAALLLLAAVTLPALSPTSRAPGWSRALVLGSVAGFAVVGAGASGRQAGSETIAAALVLAFLAVLGMVPFGWHEVRWLEDAPPALAALVATAFLPGMLAALVGVAPALSGLHELDRARPVLAAFGAVTVVVAALHGLGARDWRSLALRTLPCDLGLALIAVAAFDTAGVQAAALTLALVAVARPLLVFADALGPRSVPGLAAVILALLALVGLPPTLGFPARLLTLETAARIAAPVAALVVAGLIFQAAAVGLVLRRRLALAPDPAAPRAHRPLAVAISVASAVVLVGGGLLPGVLLRYGFQLGG